MYFLSLCVGILSVLSRSNNRYCSFLIQTARDGWLIKSEINQNRIELSYELTFFSCTLWLCQSWSWWGQCSPRLSPPATHRSNDRVLNNTISNHFLTMTPAVMLQNSTSSIFLPPCDGDIHPTEVMIPVNQTCQLRMLVTEAWQAISNTVAFRKHSKSAWQFLQWQVGRETAVAETSMTHLQPPMPHTASVAQ